MEADIMSYFGNKKSWSLIMVLVPLLLSGCSTTYKNQNVLKQQFPSVSGKNLEKTFVQLPNHFAGAHTILLLGYKQNSQFDIDRWILGLTDSGVQTKVYEIPTVVGMVPELISGKIDNGMRSGIPKELWVDVITLYGNDAKNVAQFTGNEGGLNSRVILLNPKGKIIFFHDKGYAVNYLKKLIALLPDNGNNK